MTDRRPYTEPFGQFCDILNRFGVDFVVIGSEAVAFHGIPRFSVDFDVFVRPTTVNLFRVKAALEAAPTATFQFASSGARRSSTTRRPAVVQRISRTWAC